ncbi:MAG: site-specific integrase [Candidatus Kapaibacterium sp.]
MSKKFNFTKSRLLALPYPPSGKRLIVWDSQVHGLQCRITANGVATFCLYRRVKNGGPIRVTLGRLADMTVEQARNKANRIISSMVEGENPAEVRRAHREEMTFQELFAEYLERHAKPQKRTWKKDQGMFTLYLEKRLGKKRLSEITRTDLAFIHSDISKQVFKTKKENGKPKRKSGATANRILALISSVFGWSIAVGLHDTNPARGIRKNPERSRDRFLYADELPRFFKSLAVEENTTIRDYILISLLTGARRGNVLAMRWDQISFERNEWRIPQTKNGEPQTLPLTEEAIDILRQRKDNGSEFVFPGDGKNGHLAETRRGWARILERAGIENLRIHDLRRTLGSWQAKTGASLIVIGKSLGHKSPQATAVYARLDLDPVRKSMEAATSAMLRAAQGSTSIGQERP